MNLVMINLDNCLHDNVKNFIKGFTSDKDFEIISSIFTGEKTKKKSKNIVIEKDAYNEDQTVLNIKVSPYNSICFWFKEGSSNANILVERLFVDNIKELLTAINKDIEFTIDDFSINQNTPFEVHITSDALIHHSLDKSIKTIAIENLTPDHSVLYTEHMTSVVYHCDYTEVLEKVISLMQEIASKDLPIYRVKIECPMLPNMLSKALYIECHSEDINLKLPLSRNATSGKLMVTDRSKIITQDFVDRNKGKQVEICVLDTAQDKDNEWMKLWLSQ